MGHESGDSFIGSSAESHKAEINMSPMLPFSSWAQDPLAKTYWLLEEFHFLACSLLAVGTKLLSATRSCPSPSAIRNVAACFLPDQQNIFLKSSSDACQRKFFGLIISSTKNNIHFVRWHNIITGVIAHYIHRFCLCKENIGGRSLRVVLSCLRISDVTVYYKQSSA